MSKPFLTYDDQIKKLTDDKQMTIANPAYAKTVLSLHHTPSAANTGKIKVLT